jgi:ribosomal protein S18 acetylase RimI-like enzyme
MPAVIRPASSLSLADLTTLFNAGYEGYLIPFHVDEDALRWMTESFDIDLDASRVAIRDGEPTGFANLALRGDEAWIGGVGVVTAARRQGLGEQLMLAVHEEAERRGVAKIWLEVIEENDAAYRLYLKLGYDFVREVEVWSLSAEVPAGAAREIPVAQAHARIRELRTGREPWQRADETLGHFADVRGLETDAGAALFRVSGAVQVLQIAGGDSDELLRTLRGHGTVSVLNLPADDPAAESLSKLGATPRVRQREMVLSLEPRG